MSSTRLAELHEVSFSHLQKVVQSLQAAGFVATFRGRGGGVELARLPGDLTVGEVVRALEPHLDLVDCFRGGRSRCVLTGGCGLTATLMRAKAAMLAELDGATLESLVGESPRARALMG